MYATKKSRRYSIEKSVLKAWEMTWAYNELSTNATSYNGVAASCED